MNKSRKNIWIALVVIVVIATAGFAVSRQIAARSAASESPATEAAVVQRGDLAVTIDATGSLLPRTEIALAFPAGGRVVGVLFQEGDTVRAGETIARLDGSEQLDATVATAEVELLNARQALEALSEDLDVRQAQAWGTYINAREVYSDTLEDRDNLNSLFDSPLAEDAREELAEAQGLVRQLRAYYNSLPGDPDTNPEKAKALFNLKMARMDAARAQELVDQFGDEPTPAELEQAEADLALAEAHLAKARRDYEAIQEGPDPDELVAAQARVKAAEAGLKAAQAALENLSLVSPFSGTLSDLQHKVGEYVNPGQTAVVVSELDAMQAEINLDETDVARISIGTPVAITLDAFPGAELTGKVIDIALFATVQSGVVLYPVTVSLEPTDLPLRPDMTTNVTIIVEKRENTLIVPFRAVETEGGQAYVTRVTASGSERVAVTMGLITDTQVEILSGIEEGDVVTVYANPVQDTELMNNPMFGGGQ